MACLELTVFMEKVCLCMKAKIIMWETGSITKLKEKDHFITTKVWFIVANGTMTKFMGGGKKDGLMELYLLACSKRDLKLKENSLGLMEIHIKVTLKTINYLVLENLLGVMVDFIKESGKII